MGRVILMSTGKNSTIYEFRLKMCGIVCILGDLNIRTEAYHRILTLSHKMSGLYQHTKVR